MTICQTTKKNGTRRSSSVLVGMWFIKEIMGGQLVAIGERFHYNDESFGFYNTGPDFVGPKARKRDS